MNATGCCRLRVARRPPGAGRVRPGPRRRRRRSSRRRRGDAASARRPTCSVNATSARVDAPADRRARARAARPARRAPRGCAPTASAAAVARPGPDAAGGGASSSTTCALVPPMPNELTPARRGVPLVSHGRARRVDEERARARIRCADWASSKCRLGGSSPCLSASAALISPATPAAASRWPMLVLTEPMAQDAAGRRRRKARGQRRDLDRIAERRAGAVRFDVADGRRLDPGCTRAPPR